LIEQFRDPLVASLNDPSWITDQEQGPTAVVVRDLAEMPVPEWRERLVCSKCGSREIGMVVTGTKRRPDS
jgi:hypothetical protein